MLDATDARIAGMHDRPVCRTGEARDAIRDIVRAACLVAGHDDIGAVRVILPERPTLGDILRARHFAIARGMDVTLGASDLAFRRAPVVDETARDDASEAPGILRRFVMPCPAETRADAATGARSRAAGDAPRLLMRPLGRPMP